MALTDKLNAIGDAIREKTGKTEKLTLDQMPEEIASISGSGSGGSDTSDATATASDIRLGKTAYVKGRKITGTLEIPATALSMSNAQISLDAFGAVALSVSLVPENSTDEADIVWTSDNEAVATVDGGNVVWKGSGSCNITAKLQNRGLSATCAITCGSATLALNPTNVSLEIEGTASVTAYLLPANEEVARKIVWESDNTAVATVENGVITWVGQGSCTVTASIPEYGLSASCTVRSAAVPTDIMSHFKYLGPTTYSPGTYTAWCPTGLIYDETRDVYAHFMTVQSSHYGVPSACETWFNTIDPYTLEHSEPILVARTGETHGVGALGTCIKDGVYYAFSATVRGFYKSADGGKTWSHEDYEVGPGTNNPNPWGCYVLSNGRMIMGSDWGNNEVYYSDDNGKNWTTVQSENFNEPTFIDFGGGTVMAICRENKDANGNLQPPWMHVSSDYGATWTESVAMTTVGYMGNNNCNAYVHDNFVELFIGSRGFTDSPQYDGTTYEIRQYVMDLNKGAVDDFGYVNTVYKCLPDDNPQGLTGINGADHFSTPCIAIKDKTHSLLMFYGAIGPGVTHLMVAVGNLPVDDFEIPKPMPTDFNASQVFTGTKVNGDIDTVEICDFVGSYSADGYPCIDAGNNRYVLLDDIEDGGYVHVRAPHNSHLGWEYPVFTNVKDLVLYAGQVGDTALPATPAPVGATTFKGANAAGQQAGYFTKQTAQNGYADVYARFKDNAWWLFCDGTWIRNYTSDSGIQIPSSATGSGADSAYLIPYTKGGLTTYKALSLGRTAGAVQLLEYDKDYIACTALTLNKNTLMFGGDTAIQTLSCTVSPDNCNMPVVWDVSASDVVRISEGKVIPIGNGSATITVTCGDYSASCEVTVKNIAEYVNDGLLMHLDVQDVSAGDTTWTDRANDFDFAMSGFSDTAISDDSVEFAIQQSVICEKPIATTDSGVTVEFRVSDLNVTKSCNRIYHTFTKSSGTGYLGGFALIHANGWGGQTGFCVDLPGVGKLSTKAVVTEGAEHTVAVTYAKKGTVKIFVDGVESASLVSGKELTSPILNAIGYLAAFGNEGFEGKLKSFRVYNRVLSSDELVQNYASDSAMFG